MDWTDEQEIKAQIQKWWERGDILASIASGQSIFPRRLKFRYPGSVDLTEKFDEVRQWVNAIRRSDHVRLAMREVNHRVLGKNSLPTAAWIDSLEDALTIIGKKKETQRFCALLEATRQSHPHLVGWLIKRPLKALALFDNWQQLLDVIDWHQLNPNSDIYIRQVDTGSIHSKFIEEHQSVLTELIDFSQLSKIAKLEATPRATDAKPTQFASRFGFKSKPVRIHFRVLDRDCSLIEVDGDEYISLNADSFASLKLKAHRIFIVENETNFLSFPQTKGAIVIFGSGYGFNILAQAKWLYRCKMYYWGDIDTHGFAILSAARSHWPHLQSFLMDEKTLLAHRSSWVDEDSPHNAETFDFLTADEQNVYANLRNQMWGKNVRFEQEFVGWNLVVETIERLS